MRKKRAERRRAWRRRRRRFWTTSRTTSSSIFGRSGGGSLPKRSSCGQYWRCSLSRPFRSRRDIAPPPQEHGWTNTNTNNSVCLYRRCFRNGPRPWWPRCDGKRERTSSTTTRTGRRTLCKRSTSGKNSRTTIGITTRVRRKRRGNTRRRTAARRLPCALKRARSLTFSGGIISSTEG